MNRCIDLGILSEPDVPRRSGDEPTNAGYVVNLWQCSPQERG